MHVFYHIMLNSDTQARHNHVLSEVQIMAIFTAVTLVFVFCPSKHSEPVHFTSARQQKLNILHKDLIEMCKQTLW